MRQLSFPLCLALLLCAQSASAAEPPKVVTSILPLHSLAASVMQGVGAPQLLVRGAATPHSFALRPSDAAALQEADLVIWVGEGLESFLEAPLASLSERTRVLEFAETSGVNLLPNREETLWPTGSDHGHEEHHDHGHGAYDPHIWLDLGNAIAAVKAIADALADIDPAHGDIYRANAEDTVGRLAALDAALNRRLEPLIGRPYVVFHDGYRYFEARYGLTPIGAVTLSPDRSPGARHLAEIRERLSGSGAVCIFSEPQFEPKLLETVVEGTDVRKAVLDPLGVGLEPGPEAYFTLMEDMADSLTGCLKDGG